MCFPREPVIHPMLRQRGIMRAPGKPSEKMDNPPPVGHNRPTYGYHSLKNHIDRELARCESINQH